MDNVKKKYRFGIVFPWPGIKNAETEVISRIKKAADEIGAECIALDNFGFVLDETYNLTKEKVQNVDFIISTHFETPKVEDVFYYHTLWNPPEFPLDRDNYLDLMNNYVMYDDYLIYDKGSMSNHLKSMLLDSPRNLETASSLMSTFPKSAVIKPDLSNPKLFYCGMNWDVLVDHHGRNESIMKLLDDADVIKIFGPNASTNKAWGGIHPWGGYKCYQYPIPFDGFTLLEELNKCGICLVLSSDVHRRAGAVTNRAFEACAAGAVIISDNNPLMKEMFGDSALFVDYNKKNPQETFKQIMEKYEWILSHKDQAYQLADQSQQLFLEKYTLNDYLKNMIENHPKREQAVAEAVFAKDESSSVLVNYICNTQKQRRANRWIEHVLDNVRRQLYGNIQLQLIVDQSVAEAVQAIAVMEDLQVKVVAEELFDSGGMRIKTDGQIFKECMKNAEYDYFVLTNADEYWFRDHITTLVRASKDSESLIAVSGQLVTNRDGTRRVHAFHPADNACICSFAGKKSYPAQMAYPYPGCFMFSRAITEYIPDCIFDCLDGREYMAFIHLLKFKYRKPIAFSKRMTFAFAYKYMDKRHSLVNELREWRFILGLTQYVDNELKCPNNGTSIVSVRDWIPGIPLKSFIRMRCYRILLRFASEGGAVYHWFSKRYMKALEDYNRLSKL